MSARLASDHCGDSDRFILVSGGPVQAAAELVSQLAVVSPSPPPPAVSVVRLAGAGHGIAQPKVPAAGAGRFRRGRRIAGTVAST
jgi:hypothetical protein